MIQTFFKLLLIKVFRKSTLIYLFFFIFSLLIIFLLYYILTSTLFNIINNKQELFKEVVMQVYPTSSFNKKVKTFTDKKCEIVKIDNKLDIVKNIYKNYPKLIYICENLKENSYSNIFGLIAIDKKKQEKTIEKYKIFKNKKKYMFLNNEIFVEMVNYNINYYIYNNPRNYIRLLNYIKKYDKQLNKICKMKYKNNFDKLIISKLCNNKKSKEFPNFYKEYIQKNYSISNFIKIYLYVKKTKGSDIEMIVNKIKNEDLKKFLNTQNIIFNNYILKHK